MQLSKSNIWLWLYRYNSGDFNSLPKSICPLFWGGLFGSLCFILSPLYNIFTYIEGKIQNYSFTKQLDLHNSIGILRVFYNTGIIFFYLTTVMMGAGLFGYSTENGEATKLPLWIWLIGWLTPILLMGLIVIIIYIVVKYFSDREYTQKNIEREPSVFIEGVKSFIDKVCPVIKWKDD